MSSFIFCSLSIGLPYTRDYTIPLIKEILSMTTSRLAITTDQVQFLQAEFPNEPRLILTHFDSSKHKLRLQISPYPDAATDFNFNLKYLVFEPILDAPEPYVVYTDCDNSMIKWEEDVILNRLATEHKLGFTFFAERGGEGALAGIIKEYLRTFLMDEPPGLGWHKIWAFDLLHHPRPKWENASFPSEHFLILTNKDDMVKKFCLQWKELHDKLVALPYTHGTWAEGVEIGIAAIEAGYKSDQLPIEISDQYKFNGRKPLFWHPNYRED